VKLYITIKSKASLLDQADVPWDFNLHK
jgi:hypothetical protein